MEYLEGCIYGYDIFGSHSDTDDYTVKLLSVSTGRVVGCQTNKKFSVPAIFLFDLKKCCAALKEIEDGILFNVDVDRLKKIVSLLTPIEGIESLSFSPAFSTPDIPLTGVQIKTVKAGVKFNPRLSYRDLDVLDEILDKVLDSKDEVLFHKVSALRNRVFYYLCER